MLQVQQQITASTATKLCSSGSVCERGRDVAGVAVVWAAVSGCAGGVGRRSARAATTGPTVTRIANNNGRCPSPATMHRSGNPWRGKPVTGLDRGVLGAADLPGHDRAGASDLARPGHGEANRGRPYGPSRGSIALRVTAGDGLSLPDRHTHGMSGACAGLEPARWTATDGANVRTPRYP